MGVIRIAISLAAFDAICATLPAGSVGYEPQLNEKGECLIWLEAAMVDRLGAMRGPGRELQRRDPADRGAGGQISMADRYNEGKALDAVLRFIEARDNALRKNDGWSPDDPKDPDPDPLRRVRLRLHGRAIALCLRAHPHRALPQPNQVRGPQPEALRSDHRAFRSSIRSGVLGTYRSRRCVRRVDRERTSVRCKTPSSNGSRRTLRSFRSPRFTTDALTRLWVSSPMAFRFGFLCTGPRLKAPITRATVPFAVGSRG